MHCASKMGHLLSLFQPINHQPINLPILQCTFVRCHLGDVDTIVEEATRLNNVWCLINLLISCVDYSRFLDAASSTVKGKLHKKIVYLFFIQNQIGGEEILQVFFLSPTADLQVGFPLIPFFCYELSLFSYL